MITIAHLTRKMQDVDERKNGIVVELTLRNNPGRQEGVLCGRVRYGIIEHAIPFDGVRELDEILARLGGYHGA